MLRRCQAPTFGSTIKPLECDEPATCFLYSPDGIRVPSGALCRFHGKYLVDRFNINTDGEAWSLRGLVNA